MEYLPFKDLQLVRAGDYWQHGIRLKVSCSCGRERILDGWWIASLGGAEWRWSAARLEMHRHRFRCGSCGAVAQKLELGVFD